MINPFTISEFFSRYEISEDAVTEIEGIFEPPSYLRRIKVNTGFSPGCIGLIDYYTNTGIIKWLDVLF